MDENLVEIELDSRALEFIKESLRKAGDMARSETKQADGASNFIGKRQAHPASSLAHHLLEREDLANGRITTCVGGDVPTDALYRFREGGKLQVDTAAIVYQKSGCLVPKPNTDPWLASIVQEHLRTERHGICIFNYWIASPGDPWIAKLKRQPHVFQNQVYFAVLHEDAENKGEIESTIARTKDVWLSYGAISSLPEGSGLDPKGGSITGDILEMLARRTEKIVIGAYDGESYLIWSKPS